MSPGASDSDSRALIARAARDADVDAISDMLDDFSKGHPSHAHARSRDKLREAYFGAAPVAHLVVAEREGLVIGMAQWTKIYEMFWSAYGATVEWLYVRPQFRRSGIVTAIVAEVCAQVRSAGGEFLYGGGGDEVEPLYERVAVGGPSHHCHLSAEAFQVFADLAGLRPREIVRGLPATDLNHQRAVARDPLARSLDTCA